MEKTYWTEKKAAEYLNRSVETLRSWRKKGVGPVFIVDPMGRVHYEVEKIREWLNSKE